MSKQAPRNSRNWSTPLTVVTFLFTAVSGLMLFLHFGEGLVKEAHEWIGIVFVIGALLHVKVNWTPLKRYFSMGLPRAVMASVLAGSLAFTLATGHESGGNPMIAAIKTIEAAPLTVVAQLQSRDADELHMLLEAEGYNVSDNFTTLKTIASENGRSGRELIALLFGQHQPAAL